MTTNFEDAWKMSDLVLRLRAEAKDTADGHEGAQIATLERTLARLRIIQLGPRGRGWDSCARADAIKAFVDFHYGVGHKENTTEAFLMLLIAALEHEVALECELGELQ